MDPHPSSDAESRRDMELLQNRPTELSYDDVQNLLVSYNITHQTQNSELKPIIYAFSETIYKDAVYALLEGPDGMDDDETWLHWSRLALDALAARTQKDVGAKSANVKEVIWDITFTTSPSKKEDITGWQSLCVEFKSDREDSSWCNEKNTEIGRYRRGEKAGEFYFPGENGMDVVVTDVQKNYMEQKDKLYLQELESALLSQMSMLQDAYKTGKWPPPPPETQATPGTG